MQLTVVVQDKGTPTTLSSQARLLILVRDENDVMPSFTQDSYSVEVSQLSRCMHTVGCVCVCVQVSEGEASFPHRVMYLEYRDGDTLAQFRRSTFSILAVERESSLNLTYTPPPALLTHTTPCIAHIHHPLHYARVCSGQPWTVQYSD